MPPELILQVLSSLSDPNDLLNAIRASTLLYEVYIANRTCVNSAVALNNLCARSFRLWELRDLPLTWITIWGCIDSMAGATIERIFLSPPMGRKSLRLTVRQCRHLVSIKALAGWEVDRYPQGMEKVELCRFWPDENPLDCPVFEEAFDYPFWPWSPSSQVAVSLVHNDEGEGFQRHEVEWRRLR